MLCPSYFVRNGSISPLDWRVWGEKERGCARGIKYLSLPFLFLSIHFPSECFNFSFFCFSFSNVRDIIARERRLFWDSAKGMFGQLIYSWFSNFDRIRLCFGQSFNFFQTWLGPFFGDFSVPDLRSLFWWW